MNKSVHNEESKRPFNFVLLSAMLVIMVAILSFGAWYIWQEIKRHDQSTRGTENITTPSDADLPVEEGADAEPHLVIEEWKIKVPLGDNLRNDVEYGMFTAVDGQQTAFFTSKAVTQKAGANSSCSLKAVNDNTGNGVDGGLVALTRFKQQPSDVPKELYFEYDTWWYVFDFSNSGACYQGDTGQESGRFTQEMEQSLRRISNK